MCAVTCSQCDRLYLYLYGELDGPETAEFEEHIRDCPACREELAHARRLKRILVKPYYKAESSDVEDAAADATTEFIQRRGKAQRRALVFEMVAIAAGVLLVISLYGLFFRGYKALPPANTPVAEHFLAWESVEAARLSVIAAELSEYARPALKAKDAEPNTARKNPKSELEARRQELSRVVNTDWEEW